ncbi:ferritin-like domain-containing protein [Hymenobacter negativus]|uniref:Ferritin-like domain-containing protein n=1 Tax=Hymenobacter negativus TaxID=2795026 RepID=A0ABS3QGZ9_9BACT|nr:ferritin-like domain-containing protein [Hymenobacter negativus]MBO2010532.1 ferritin-like domain-containing protein [Hymenobacter negativus]
MSDYTFFPAWREQSLGRRVFLRVSAASAASVALIAAGCSDSTPEPVTSDPNLLTLPSGDSGLLYYAYLLSLAQTTLYQKAVDVPPSDFTATDRSVFADLRDHAIVHRELFRYFIDPAGTAVLFPTDFVFNLTSFTLTSRAGVLAAAQQIADLAAAAFPVLLTLFTASGTSQRLMMLKAGSVVSRQAAAIRDLLTPGSFASSNVVDSTGLLITKTPMEVNTALAPYFAPYVISVANLAVPV